MSDKFADLVSKRSGLNLWNVKIGAAILLAEAAIFLSSTQ